MGESDIILEDDRVLMIKGLEISHDAETEPSIELLPSKGNAILGGGDDPDADGDVYLLDRGSGATPDTHSRIQLSASGGDALSVNRVYVDGSSGSIELGATGLRDGDGNSTADVTIRPNWAALTLGGGGGSNSDGDIKLQDRDDNTRIHASGGGGEFFPETTRIEFQGDSGTIRLGAKALEDGDGNGIADVTIRPKWAALTLGGGGGSNSDGDIKLQDRDDNTRIHLTGGRGSEFDTTRVQANGRTGTVKIGGNGREGSIELVDDLDRAIGVIATKGTGMQIGTPGYETVFRNGVVVEGDSNMGPGQVELTDDEGNTAGAVRATSEGLELTDGEGNVGLRIESGGTVKVKDGSVEEL